MGDRKKRGGMSQCDTYCSGCVYAKCLGSGWNKTAYCSYLFETGKRRPCPAGSGCTEWADKMEERADA